VLERLASTRDAAHPKGPSDGNQKSAPERSGAPSPPPPTGGRSSSSAASATSPSCGGRRTSSCCTRGSRTSGRRSPKQLAPSRTPRQTCHPSRRALSRPPSLLAAASRHQARRPLALRLQVQLSQLALFDHGRSCTLWCDPQSPELLRLQARLEAAFPHCSDLSSDAARGISSYRPHLSLGQWRGAEQAAAALQVRRAAGLPGLAAGASCRG
jgi:hypothetical protein